MREVRHTLDLTVSVNADAEAVYELISHMEQFPLFMPDVESVEVVERRNGQTVTEWVAYIDEDTPINWKELDTFEKEKKVIAFKLLEGDLDLFEGEWRIEETDQGVQVALNLTYDFGMPAFEKIIGPVLKKKVRDNAKMMLESIQKKLKELS